MMEARNKRRPSLCASSENARNGLLHGIRALTALIVVLLLFSCARPPVTGPRDALQPVPWRKVGTLQDDLALRDLSTAAQRSLEYYRRIPASSVFQVGPHQVSAAEMAETLETFLSIIEHKTSAPKEKAESIKQNFSLYRSVGHDGRGNVLFTGYYSPMISCALKEQGMFRYPLYKRPDDIIEVDLTQFGNTFRKNRLFGRLEGKKVVPYYTREEIDHQKALGGKGLELLWCADPVDIFMLQIQGSGKVDIVGGDVVSVLYNGQNGQPYRSIGKHLIDINAIPKDEMSMQAIRKYLSDNPGKIYEILNRNPSYVFFRIDTGPAVGSIGVPVTGGRTIATDSSLFPKGALGIIQTEKPVMNEEGEITEWIPFTRFVLNQDTGGAINGAGRVDLFWGHGSEAETAAGYMQQEGELFFLVKKRHE